ncbi:hypothetical protein ACFLRO_01275 [Bacteroidota bacterium]
MITLAALEQTAPAFSFVRKTMKLFQVFPSLAVVLIILSPSMTAVAQDTTAVGPNRSGFTLFLGLGVGFQSDAVIEESAVGLGGLALGLGGFVNENLAIMVRVSGTTVEYSTDQFSLTQTSGVGAITLQYWPSDKFNLEGGPGMGFWTTEFSDDQAFGLIAAAGYSVFQSRKVNLQVGAEWAPAFTEGGTVSNLSLNFGFQLL